MNDMTISQNETIGCDDETRAVAGELARSALEINALFDVDVHNGWGDTRDSTYHGAGILIEQGGIVLACCGCVDLLARC
jgi:hypothetical protein